VAFANAAQAASPQANTDAISLSTDGIIPPTGTQQPLHLTDAQRAQIRQALAGLQTQVEFKLKKVKKAKDFTPTVGAKLPKGVTPHGLPGSLTQKIPGLGDYAYVKMKGEVLIVNAMSHKIVDLIPLT
jgi:hypothetical protein